MRKRAKRSGIVLALLFILLFSAEGLAYNDGPPVAALYPDDLPVHGNFFFSAGSPLERFTNQKDAWYAVYQTSLYPGYPYAVVLRHKGDPSRMKVYALDNHPFEKVSMKFELVLRKAVMPYDQGYKGPVYEAIISLPKKAKTQALFLLLEWRPSAGNDRPLPVSIQVLSTGYGQLMGRGRKWSGPQSYKWRQNSSMQSGRPVVIPVP